MVFLCKSVYRVADSIANTERDGSSSTFCIRRPLCIGKVRCYLGYELQDDPLVNRNGVEGGSATLTYPVTTRNYK